MSCASFELESLPSAGEERLHKLSNSFHSSRRSLSRLRPRSDGLHDGQPGAHDAAAAGRPGLPPGLRALPASRILRTSFVINGVRFKGECRRPGLERFLSNRALRAADN